MGLCQSKKKKKKRHGIMENTNCNLRWPTIHTCVRDISPYKARASVLGIGVADMARTWGAIYSSPFEGPSKLLAPILELSEV